MASHLRDEKDSRKLAAISVVAAGYAGDMPEELANVTPGTGTSVTLRGQTRSAFPLCREIRLALFSLYSLA